MGRAQFKITHTLLADILLLPKDAKIASIFTEANQFDEACIIVESPDVAEVAEGAEIPTVYPEWQMDATSTFVDTPKFSGWGLPLPNLEPSPVGSFFAATIKPTYRAEKIIATPKTDG